MKDLRKEFENKKKAILTKIVERYPEFNIVSIAFFSTCLQEAFSLAVDQQRQELREKLENIKVHCPTCPLPHNLSSKDIERILAPR